MKITNPFSRLSRGEVILWVVSLIAVTVPPLFTPQPNALNIIASVIGVTALILCSKGLPSGQGLIVVFSVFYGVISFKFRYWGEMITYLGMSAPIALLALIQWIKNPYDNTGEVRVNTLRGRNIIFMCLSAVGVTAVFYFILRLLNTPNLILSTISVATSYVASYLTYMRSPYYALAYSANDGVLIILWVLACVEDISYLPMVICFMAFLVNDIYGFVSWSRMLKRQRIG